MNQFNILVFVKTLVQAFVSSDLDYYNSLLIVVQHHRRSDKSAAVVQNIFVSNCQNVYIVQKNGKHL